MKLSKLLLRASALLLVVGLSACGQATSSSAESSSATTKTVYNRRAEKEAIKLERQNSQKQTQLDKQAQKLKQKKQALKKQPTKSKGQTNLATLAYHGSQEVSINHDNPGFTKAQLKTSAGAWQKYGNLDSLNRVTVAEALLNQSLMPTAKREALTVSPTGWHNKRTNHGWLYNRSHLIGYQFTGQNNNPKNLMTGTRTLNSPLMLHNEMDVATYLKASAGHYVRYEVKPIFRGNELVARGVQMRAQSIGSNAVHFNRYIFNIEPGYTIDYSTGYSRAS